MIGSLGMPELLFILVLALLVFGPKRLPQVGRTLGKGLREFRRATNDLKRSVEVEINADDPPAPGPKMTAAIAKPSEDPPAQDAAADDLPSTEGPSEDEWSEGAAEDSSKAPAKAE